ncbi:prepilin-type N-terminal cleavage/methylation domain-containing protein [Acetobacter orleanensis]|uniref:Uncharacterized protein n=1 Tax=Acetobacter orleanensis TaxID=104099 RepID=A0A4Y3TP66_9PROT|nr:prepilin-type N-terminal cleavage/methylation domain-containing protein [Acetobacter orleanensis]PCD78648.1 prepilin-type cleavage/methylation domain-containing protein [Acetobacter orleanensis]GAN67284.1 pseudopilin I [Acetobacter orleanensis JCM 7639]GBR23938.1 hypothetical protein AA0473_0511 [Acetobacter orleanensis NRIC 0473]GEB83543.1 hypothetical protein AOR01nite_20200 [Acetobacter orleanensis]
MATKTGRPDEQGFTLLEVVVAIAIAAAGMAVLAVTLGGALENTTRSGYREEALSRARSRLDSALVLTHPIIGRQEGQDPDGYRWVTETRQIATLPSGRGMPLAFYAVDVEVLWGRGARVHLTGRRFGPPATP